MDICEDSERQNNMLLNQEAVVNERLNSLKKTVSTYRGHLTRCYRELRELMSDPSKYTEINSKRRMLDGVFESYKEASDEKKFVQDQRASELSRYIEFVKLYSEWLPRNLSLLPTEQNQQSEMHDETNSNLLTMTRKT